jgi:site-specific DNA-methyltransferase (adenine-specific)
VRVETIGNATLYLGDCREVLASLPKVDAVVTDPPYGVGLKTKTSDYRQSAYFDAGESMAASVTYDDDPETIRNLIESVMPWVLANADRAVITPGARMMFSYPEPASVGAVFTPNGAGRSPWGFQCSHPILYYGKDPYLADGKGSRPNGFRTEQPNREKIDHPCPKPIEWMNWLVNRGTRHGETVLDPFMGSGTTGVACMNLGRAFVGIELEPKYFAIACKRIEQAQKQRRLFA